LNPFLANGETGFGGLATQNEFIAWNAGHGQLRN
jgi:hypothetical protein